MCEVRVYVQWGLGNLWGGMPMCNPPRLTETRWAAHRQRMLGPAKDCWDYTLPPLNQAFSSTDLPRRYQHPSLVLAKGYHRNNVGITVSYGAVTTSNTRSVCRAKSVNLTDACL